MDGTGRPDLVVANDAASTLSVLLNTTAIGATSPTLAPRLDLPTGYGPRSLVTTDVNGDGTHDIVTANTYQSTISILVGE